MESETLTDGMGWLGRARFLLRTSSLWKEPRSFIRSSKQFAPCKSQPPTAQQRSHPLLCLPAPANRRPQNSSGVLSRGGDREFCPFDPSDRVDGNPASQRRNVRSLRTRVAMALVPFGASDRSCERQRLRNTEGTSFPSMGRTNTL